MSPFYFVLVEDIFKSYILEKKLMSDLNNPTSQAVKDPAHGQAVRDDDRNHVFHSWSAQGYIVPVSIADGLVEYNKEVAPKNV